MEDYFYVILTRQDIFKQDIKVINYKKMTNLATLNVITFVQRTPERE